MINLFSVKVLSTAPDSFGSLGICSNTTFETQKAKAAETGTGTNVVKQKQIPSEMRLQKDMAELNLPTGVTIAFPDGKDKLSHFEMAIRPDEGIYRGGRFVFDFVIGTGYPYDAPKVKCKTKVYHPNIDLDGNICLNILREDWKPVLSVSSIVFGLQFLFVDPNPEDPLNKEAAVQFQENPRHFESAVQRAITSGHTINGQYFPPCV